MSERSLLAAVLVGAVAAFGSAAAASANSPSRASLVALTEVADIEALAVSPDFRSVAFRVHRPSIARNTYAIAWYVADLMTGTVTSVGDGGEVIYDNGVIEVDAPVWAPDNRAFFRRALVAGAIGIWRTAADGTGSSPVVVGEADVERIAASADGRSLLYWTGPTRAALANAEQAEYDDGILIDARVDTRQGLFRPAYSHGRLATQRLTGYWYAREALLWREPRTRHRLDLLTHTSVVDGQEPARTAPTGPAPGERTVTSPAGDVAVAPLGQESGPLTLEVRRAAGSTFRCIHPVCRGGMLALAGWRPGRDEVVFTRRDGHFRQSLYTFAPASGRVRRIARGQGLLGGGRDWHAPCVLAQGSAICVEAAAASPPRLRRIDLDTGRSQTLFDPNLGLRARATPTVEYLTVSAGGDRHATAILLTPTKPSKRLPLFVMYYICPGYLRGGMGDEFPFGPLIESGFAVACFNYVTMRPGETAIDDYRHAQTAIGTLVDELARKQRIDPRKVAMGGLSFGSEVTMWLAMHSDLLAAAAAASPQPSPSGFWQSAIRGRDTLEHYRKRWRAGHPDEDLESWRPISPELNVGRIKAPLLMQLPEQEIVSVLQFYARMTHTTTPIELYAYPHESHTKLQPRHRFAVYRRNLDWVRYWLQGHVDPDPASAAQFRRWEVLRARRDASAE